MAHSVTPSAGEPPEEPHRTGLRTRFPAHAVLRGFRAAVVLPAVLAFGLLVVGDPELAGFAAFGAFASLVIASFTGSRSAGALAFALLLAVGGLMVAAGCLASLSLASAVLVTLPLAFLAYYFAIEGPHGGSGATAALLGYVLAASTPAPLSELPVRVGGWCLGVAAGGIAALLVRAPSGEDSFRLAVSRTTRALGGHLSALLDGTSGPDEARSSEKAVGTMLTEFASGMHQPSGTRSADRALTDVVGALLWAKGLIGEAANRCVGGLSRADGPETELLEASAELLCRTADFLDGESPEPDVTQLRRLLAAYGTRVDCMDQESPPSGTFVSHAFYTANIGEAAATTAVETVRAVRRPPSHRPHIAWRRAVAPCGSSSLRHVAGRARHSSVVTAWRDSATMDSIWFVNALRSAVAMALTIVVVHLAGLDRGFWALLGVLAVLRTSVASTGSRAVVALLGTVAGVVVGGVLIGLAGSDSAVVWAVFPVVVWLAAFSPGALPDAVGQAAFTVVVLCLYTLISPSGWQLGLVRLQDVAVGAAVSLLVGALMWPRGAAGVLRSNMAEVFRLGGRDLTASTGWALGFVTTRPCVRLTSSSPETRHMHDSLRGFLAEPVSRGMERADLCFLSSSAVWLRMTTSGLARQSQVVLDQDPDRFRLGDLASQLATFYTRLGDRLERTDVRDPAGGPPDERVALSGVTPRTCRSWWVYEYLLHLDRQAARLSAPALRLAGEPALAGRWFGRPGPPGPAVRDRSGEQW
ncbi:FUSC family protein [Streptomyces sp. HNM0645]|uniref:FUSC family protein n=1 Tax=Streptomyces sp. HNM0645 TaxID=2782343 RepID=UPI0024B733D9|nr:FUSC family protein [Streptomyces sp. HNM0645]MDI9883645.1 FUSC family protein [Streptomyces sp. HNM0645]